MSNCHRKGCTRTRSGLRTLLNRSRTPQFGGQDFCSEDCLRAQIEAELQERWHQLQREKGRRSLRPRLGTILLERSFITPDQLEAAIRMQRQARRGRLGEWLVRLGHIEEHQITLALSRQFGIPVINLQNAPARTDAVKLVPGLVARNGNLVPVGYVDDYSAIRIATCGPVDFGLQDAIRRMSGMGVKTYIGDETAVQSRLAQFYSPEELDLSGVPAYHSLSDLMDISSSVIATARELRAANIQCELVGDYFWVRLDCESVNRHMFYLNQATQIPDLETVCVRELNLAAIPAH